MSDYLTNIDPQKLIDQWYTGEEQVPPSFVDWPDEKENANVQSSARSGATGD